MKFKGYGLRQYILFLIFFLFTSEVLAQSSALNITAHENTIKLYNLTGANGLDGRDGKNAYPIDCLGGSVDGRDGEDGSNGERGENGKNAVVVFDSFYDLKNVILVQRGGRGGQGGKGGLGTIGCENGKPGRIGADGLDGDDGQYGKIYLRPKSEKIALENPAKVISINEFNSAPIYLAKHNWIRLKGAKELFHPKSDILDYYFMYEDTTEYKVTLKWSSNNSIFSFSKTKLALTIVNGELNVNNYSGGVLDFVIHKNEYGFELEVLRSFDESQFKNLTLGKLRSQGEKLTLEVKEKYRPFVDVKTKFVISLYAIDESANKSKFVGQFEIKRDLIEFKDNIFYINIGSLNFPPKYKRKGQKLRLHVSIYREARNQTRSFGIRGLFRI